MGLTYTKTLGYSPEGLSVSMVKSQGVLPLCTYPTQGGFVTAERKNRRKIAVLSVASLALLAAVGGGVTYAVYNTQANNEIAAGTTQANVSPAADMKTLPPEVATPNEEGVQKVETSYDVDKVEKLDKGIADYAKKANLADEAKKAITSTDQSTVTGITTKSSFGALEFYVTVKDGTSIAEAQAVTDKLADWARSNVKTDAWKSDPSNARVQVTALLPSGEGLAVSGVSLFEERK